MNSDGIWTFADAGAKRKGSSLASLDTLEKGPIRIYRISTGANYRTYLIQSRNRYVRMKDWWRKWRGTDVSRLEMAVLYPLVAYVVVAVGYLIYRGLNQIF